MSLILVAHGTRSRDGVAMIGDLAERIGVLLDQSVRVAFVDVLGPTPAEVLAVTAGTGEPAIVVPAFLSRGYHVRSDLPAHVAASGHLSVTITPALGPGPQITRLIAACLSDSGWRPGDSVIIAAAGSSDPWAQADLRLTARLVSELTGEPVGLAFAATGRPSVTDAVSALRSAGARRVVVVSYLLAEGVFQDLLRDSGADLVSEPLGSHPALAPLIADRFKAAYPAAA